MPGQLITSTSLHVLYQSEPILAEVAARFTSSTKLLKHAYRGYSATTDNMTYRHHMLCALEEDIFNSNVQFFAKMSKGDVGKVVGCVAVAFIMDCLREQLHAETIDAKPDCCVSDLHPQGLAMSQPVNAKDFILALCPSAERDGDFMEWLDQYEVCFTHFIRDSNLSGETSMANLYHRRAALLLGGNYDRIDACIFFQRKQIHRSVELTTSTSFANDEPNHSDDYAALVIQFKNYSEAMTDIERDCCLNSCLGEAMPELFSSATQVVCMLMTVGGNWSPSVNEICRKSIFPKNLRSGRGVNRFNFASGIESFKLLTDGEKYELREIASVDRQTVAQVPSDAFLRGGTYGLDKFLRERYSVEDNNIIWR